MLEAGFELVHTVTDYYDSPRKGIANLDGNPHFYESVWDDLEDECMSTFLLSPVQPLIFKLAMEAWSIWRRWETAFYEGYVSQETHPVLPEDKVRSDELEEILAIKLKIEEEHYLRAKGEFIPLNDPSWNGLGGQPLQVKWTIR